MAKVDVAAKTSKVYGLLKDGTPEDRQTIVRAVMTLFNEPVPSATAGSSTQQQQQQPPAPAYQQQHQQGTIGGVRQFFDAKAPTSKVEELAVAARYHEQVESASGTTREDFERLFKAAKRTFDKVHYNRDLANAKTRKLFNVGPDNILGHYGEQFVDALPNRDAAKALSRPGKSTKKTTVVKKPKKA